jgi:hypothetical protein
MISSSESGHADYLGRRAFPVICPAGELAQRPDLAGTARHRRRGAVLAISRIAPLSRLAIVVAHDVRRDGATPGLPTRRGSIMPVKHAVLPADVYRRLVAGSRPPAGSDPWLRCKTPFPAVVRFLASLAIPARRKIVI